jgi:predicted metal-dependent hydrolase
LVSYLKIGQHDIPVKIIQEWRSSTRVALGKDHVILRVPKNLFQDHVQTYLNWASSWLHKMDAQKPNVLLRYVLVKKYQDGDKLEIGNTNFVLRITASGGETAKIKLISPGELALSVPEIKGADPQKIIKSLLSKFACRYFVKAITERVHYYNNLHFRQPVNGIRLKYNKSNWGSCSRDKNLNFSVRLFLAPPEVLDYVIVHELAHLIEMNHSERFWNIVKTVMPDYKKYEKLLKVNSHLYDF